MAVLKDLIVHGNSNFLNTSYFNALEADTGKFRKLATKILGSDGETITVYGLMDVQGELHTKSWTNSNIATIDGSFFICPTLKVTETGTTSNGLTISQSGSTWTIQVTSSSAVVTNTVYTMNSSGTISSGGAWTLGSKVTITGEILIGNEWIPLGTLRGRITQRASDLKSVTISYITDGYSSSNNILTTIGTQNNVKHRNVKIALYEWSLSDSSTPASATTNPIGIYMTALGDGTGQTIIDIYGGQEAASATYKGLAKPYVRIGNLNGLSSLTIGGQNPGGWGLYTSNGYFEGTVAARRGYIGNSSSYWTIGTSGNNSILYAPSSGPQSIAATTAGMYVGTDGIRSNQSGNTAKYVQITNGVLTAYGAVINGALTATSLATGNPARTGTGTGTAGTYIASDGAIYVGSNNDFTVTAAGAVTAKSGTIGGWSINSSYGIYTNSKTSATSTNSGILIQKDGNIYAGAYNSTVGSCPFQVTNTGVLTAVNANLKGLTIYDSNGNKRAGIDSTDGFLIYDGASSTTNNVIAQFGSIVKIGQTTGENINFITIDSDGLKVYKDQSDTAAAEFGSIARIGNEWQVEIGGDSINIIDNTEDASATVTTFDGDGITFFDGLGTAKKNIIGEFGINGAIIGAEGSTTRAKFTADTFEIEDNNSLNILKIGKGEQLENTYDDYESMGTGTITNSSYVDYSILSLTSYFSRTLHSPTSTITVTIPWIHYTSATSSTSGTTTFSFSPNSTDTQTNGPLTATYNSTTSVIKIQPIGTTDTYTDCVIRDYAATSNRTIHPSYSTGQSFNGRFLLEKQVSLSVHYVIKFSDDSTKTYSLNHTFAYATLNALGLGKTLTITQTYTSQYKFTIQLFRSNNYMFKIYLKSSQASGNYGRPLLNYTNSYISYPVTGVLTEIDNVRITYNGTADAPYYNLGHREEYPAMGAYSFILGENLEAPYPRSMVIGKYNDSTEDYMFTVANGTNTESLNLFTINPTGNVQLSGTITLGNNKGIRGTTTTGETRSLCYISASDNDVFGGGSYGAGTGTAWYEGNIVRIRSKGGNGVMLDDDHNYFRPVTANATALGTTTYYWTRCYCNTSMWTASDKKLKDSIDNIDFAQDLIMNLKPVQFKLKANDHRRIHMGFIAQEVNETAKKLNKNLSFIIADYKDHSKDTYLGEDADDNELSWGLAYEELIAPTIAVVQKQQKEIEQLKKEIEELKNK